VEPTPFDGALAPISAAPQVGVTSRCWGLFAARPLRHPLPPLPGEARGRIIRTTVPGPQGWMHAVLDLLSDLL